MDVIFCKICLNMNVKMYDLHEYGLENCYRSIIGNAVEVHVMSSLRYACYECAYLLHKCHSFKKKCLRSLSVLKEVLENSEKLSPGDIMTINREDQQLCSNLVTVLDGSHCEHTDDIHCDIKEEPNMSNVLESDCDIVDIKFEGDTNVHDSATSKFASKQENAKSSLMEVKIEAELQDNDAPCADYSDEEVLKRPLKRKLKSTQKFIEKPLKKRSKKEKISDAPIKKYTKKVQKLDLKKEKKHKKSRSTIHNELTREEKKMTDVLTVKILTLEEQLENLLERKNSSNYANSNYKCDLCYKGFLDCNTYDRHMVRHNPANGSFKCPVCKTVFLTERLLRHHSKLHNRTYVCNTCCHTCTNWPQARQHQNEHTGKVYECQQCEYVTSKRSSYLSHKRLKHPSDFVCNLCSFAFVSELGLTQHTTMMHGMKAAAKEQESISDEPEKTCRRKPLNPGGYCQVCEITCNSPQKWIRHVASAKHIDKLNGDTTCGECEESFTTREALRAHYRRQHLQQDSDNDEAASRGNPFLPKTWPAKCLHCTEELYDARQYYCHFKKMHPKEEYPMQKDYICDVCGKLFRFKCALVQHRRKHSDEEVYECGHCAKFFLDRLQLANHEKIHCEDRPYRAASATRPAKLKRR